ncbi:ArsR/SmtB family transcription factor [Pedobacter metabolipauper]|uniref:ArsR family transcriptional regulator n=1 Tax=Pedobacter metabolipauper TaxID=425513 RepID=A0A4V6PW23_9SPHI|nr:metalloregulator ArsR/SmtB family transcription factor [Pedobacter metabolipauper]TDQ11203.1 ArsR family transcriptional regulator [Pedobacter metabolipauper]
MNTRRDVFQAISDPVRRNIIQRLSKETLNLNAIAGEFEVSRQAISKHIQILSECGLIVITQNGRERFCEVQPAKLKEVTDWVDEFKKHWMGRLEKLDHILKEIKTKEHGTK